MNTRIARWTVRALLGVILLAAPTGCSDPGKDPGSDQAPTARGQANMTFEVTKTDQQWQEQLTPEQYRIARKKGTEQAFTGTYCNVKTPGLFVCVCCGHPLYRSEAKFNSGTGWPSFTAPVDEGKVLVQTDNSHGMKRTEALCSRCGAHLGHVFDDGRAPTGQRHCINSASLKLVAD